MAVRIFSLIILALFALPASAVVADPDCISCHTTVNAKSFDASVHAGIGCSGCHSDIATVPHEVAPKRVDCSTCHESATTAWNESLHAAGVRSGIRSALCADCHGPVHEILPASDRAS
jgi:hypothetical protein